MAIVLPHLHRLLIMATCVDKRQTHRIQTVVAANARSKMLSALFRLYGLRGPESTHGAGCAVNGGQRDWSGSSLRPEFLPNECGTLTRLRACVRKGFEIPKEHSNRLGRVRHGRLYARRTESATHVFVEPVDRALPGQIGRGFVIPFRRRVAIEAMYGARVNIAFVRNVRRVQGLVVSRPRRCQSGVELPLMHQDRCLNFWDVLWGGRTAIERCRCRQVGSQPHR